MEQGTSLKACQPRPTEKRLRKRKELDALVTNMVYSKVRPSGHGHSNIRARNQLLTSRNSDSSDSEQFVGDDDDGDNDDDDDKQRSHNSGLTCSGGSGLTGSAGSTSGRKFRAPYTLIRNGSTCKKNPANSRRLRILCQCFCYVITAVVCFIMVGAIFWLHIQMKVQAHDFQQQLNKVMEEKDSLFTLHHSFKSEIGDLSNSQSAITRNLTSLMAAVDIISKNLEAFNHSLVVVGKSLETAPLLKSLPATVLQVQTDLAELIAKASELESQVNNAQKENHVTLDNMRDTIEGIKKQKTPDHSLPDPDQFVSRKVLKDFEEAILNRTHGSESKLEAFDAKFKAFATQITDQLQREETRATKSWELLSQLEDNVQNVSARAVSSEVLCNRNQESIYQVTQNLQQLQVKIQNDEMKLQNSIQTNSDKISEIVIKKSEEANLEEKNRQAITLKAITDEVTVASTQTITSTSATLQSVIPTV